MFVWCLIVGLGLFVLVAVHEFVGTHTVYKITPLLLLLGCFFDTDLFQRLHI